MATFHSQIHIISIKTTFLIFTAAFVFVDDPLWSNFLEMMNVHVIEHSPNEVNKLWLARSFIQFNGNVKKSSSTCVNVLIGPGIISCVSTAFFMII